MKSKVENQPILFCKILFMAISISIVCLYTNINAQLIGNTNKQSNISQTALFDKAVNKDSVSSKKQSDIYTDNSMQSQIFQTDNLLTEAKQKDVVERPILRISPSQARNIARLFLRSCNSLKVWKDASPAKVFPLYSAVDDEKPSYYEIKIETPNNNHQGQIIVSATDRDYPIPAFKPFGRTDTENLIARNGGKAARVIWHSPFYAVAVDEKGKEVATVGRKSGMILDPNDLSKMRKVKGLEEIQKRQPNKLRQQVWESLRTCLGYQESISNPSMIWTGSMTYTENPSWPDDFIFEEISGTGLHPNLEQFDWLGSVTGNGTKYFYTSGCGPTAWAALAAYYDIHGEPDLLYGTYLDDRISNYENGDPTNYLEKLIKKIHDRTDTSSVMGYINTWRGKMGRGVQVLNDYCSHNLVCDRKHELHEDLFSDYPDKKITEMILDSFNADEPVIVLYTTRHIETIITDIEVGAHYALGLGTAIGTGYLTTRRKVGPKVVVSKVEFPVRYILVDEQHGKKADDIWYIGWSKIFGVWTLPRSKQPRCPRHSYFSEEDQQPITAMDMDSLNDELYLVYPYNKNIYVRKTSAVGYPVPEKNASEGPKPITFNQKLIIPNNRYNSSAKEMLGPFDVYTYYPGIGYVKPDRVSNVPAGGISICTWNYELPTYPQLGYYLTEPEDATSETDLAAIIDWIMSTTEDGQYRAENPARDPDADSKMKSKKSIKRQVPSKEIALRMYLKEKLEEFFAKQQLLEDIKSSEEGKLRELIFTPFQIRSGPYMFLCWRGLEDSVELPDSTECAGSRIHIFVLEIPSGKDFKDVVNENGVLKADALNFAHVVLPERFLTTIDPSITVACVQGLGPKLYVAYAEPGGYTLYTQGVYSGNLGRILVIDLETFFKISTSDQDLWPTVASSPTGEPGLNIVEETKILEGGPIEGQETTVKKIVSFDWYWGYFGYSGDVKYVALESGKGTFNDNIALLWCKHPMMTTSSAWGINCWEIFFHMINTGFVFDLTGQSIGVAAPFMPDWGDCKLPVKYARYEFEFLESDYSFKEGDYWLGPIWCKGRPDILCLNEGPLITWNNPDFQIYIAKISESAEIVAELVDRTNEYGPVTDIHYVTDTLGNKNIVLGWSGRISSRALNHRILYLHLESKIPMLCHNKVEPSQHLEHFNIWYSHTHMIRTILWHRWQ